MALYPTPAYPYPPLPSRTPIPTDKTPSSPSYPQPQAPPCTSTTDPSLSQQAPRLSFNPPTHLLLLPLRPCIPVHSSLRSPSKQLPLLDTPSPPTDKSTTIPWPHLLRFPSARQAYSLERVVCGIGGSGYGINTLRIRSETDLIYPYWGGPE